MIAVIQWEICIPQQNPDQTHKIRFRRQKEMRKLLVWLRVFKIAFLLWLLTGAQPPQP